VVRYLVCKVMQSLFVDDSFTMQEIFPVPGYIGSTLHVVNLEAVTVYEI